MVVLRKPREVAENLLYTRDYIHVLVHLASGIRPFYISYTPFRYPTRILIQSASKNSLLDPTLHVVPPM